MTSNEHKIRVLIYCRYTLFREGLKALLQNVDSIEVVGEAATAKLTLRLAERLRPDVLLLEPVGADLDGSEFTRRLRLLNFHVQVLVVSLEDDENLVSNCLTAGATDCLRKGAQPEQLKSAIYKAYRGATYAA